ncbi:MAG: RNA polymerase sigma-70 factor [Tannerellaceae bacterium]|nr:RNA polymerase sigma-70 factor [Tannerellaceae bacterium]
MEDRLLVESLRLRNKDGFRLLFMRYYSPLCEYASQYISDRDAEELVQDFMLYLWENQDVWEVIETSLKSYLFVAVRNRCVNAIKKSRYHQRVRSLLYERMKDICENPDYYLANELALLIEKAVEELPESYRVVFLKSRFGALTNVKIAEELGVSVKTVEYRITQSLKLLRVALREYL